MKKLNKKGFTIVELVIVIAVIAILAAVLIPTFSGVVNKANDSAALQGARNAFTSYMSDYADKDNDVDLILINSAKTYAYEVVDGQINATALETVPTVTTHPAVNYTEAEAKAYNAGLDDAVAAGDDTGDDYTGETAITYNAALSGAVAAGAAAPADYNTKVGSDAADSTSLTAAEAALYNAELDGAVEAGDAILYTEETAASHNAGLTGAVSTSTVKTAASADTVNTNYVWVGEFNGWTVYAK